MGKHHPRTPGGCERKSPSVIKKRKAILRDIESCVKKNPTLEDMVEHPENNNCCSSNNSSGDNTGGDNNASDDYMSRKAQKVRKLDPGEERLRQMEMRHVIHRRWDHFGAFNESSSLDEEEEEASTSEDAILGVGCEPKFDLIKSQLRDRYVGKGKGDKGSPEDDGVVEMEVVSNSNSKGTQKVDLVKEGGNKKMDVVKKRVGGGSDIGERSNNRGGNGGPKFKDLGGMNVVVKTKQH